MDWAPKNEMGHLSTRCYHKTSLKALRHKMSSGDLFVYLFQMSSLCDMVDGSICLMNEAYA